MSKALEHIDTSMSATTKKVFLQLHTDLTEANAYVKNLKQRPQISVTDIENVQQIPYPQIFPASSFPPNIKTHIDLYSYRSVSIKYRAVRRYITFHFVTSHESHADTNRFIRYSQHMLTWLHMADQYASTSHCAKELAVYLYFTDINKNIPQGNMQILGQEHVNTAFTTTCPSVSEIVIFRHEEWFKVFIHETFHNLALDFSGMNNAKCNELMHKMFPVKSEINLFESYAEFWAELVNVCFCSYSSLKNKKNRPLFLEQCETMMANEMKYSTMQMVKALAYMGLTYENMHAKTPTSRDLRNTLYKERTNILAYFVIKTILMVNYQAFLHWCDTNNTSLLQFNKTDANQTRFCKFIVKYATDSAMVNVVSQMQRVVGELYNKKMTEGSSHSKGKKEKETSYLLYNLRMTIYELN